MNRIAAALIGTSLAIATGCGGGDKPPATAAAASTAPASSGGMVAVDCDKLVAKMGELALTSPDAQGAKRADAEASFNKDKASMLSACKEEKKQVTQGEWDCLMSVKDLPSVDGCKGK